MLQFYPFLVFFLLLYVGACFWVYFTQEKRIFRPTRFPADFELGLAPPHRERWFTVEEGLRLNAVHLKVNAPKGLILYHHGNSGDLSEWEKIASLLLPHHFDVLAYDYRGYGKSEGRVPKEKELFRDAQRIYDAMKEEYDETRIVLYGRSLGSGIASWLAAKNDPAMLLMETPFYSMKELVFQYYPWFPASLILKYPLRNDLHLERTTCPVHIFHGDRDKVVHYRSSRKLKRLLKQGDRFHTIEGGSHADLSDFPAFHEALENALRTFRKEEVQEEGNVRSAS